MAQSTDKILEQLIINQMPRSVYNAKKAAGELDPEQVYLPDAAYDDSLGVTDAVPGKTIKVKAVQGGKPTEWEAADIYEKPTGGIPKSDLAQSVQDALDRTGTTAWNDIKEKPFGEIGEGLKVDGGKLTVDTTDKIEQGNIKPVTSATVYTVVGNINALLASI